MVAPAHVETLPAPVTVRNKPGPKPKPKPEPVAKSRSKPGPKSGSKNKPKANGPVTPKPLPEKPTYEYPHLDARFYTTSEGQVMISVDFNKMFAGFIDSKYREDPTWNPMNEDNAKVALFLYRILTEMVEPYLEEDEGPTGEILPEQDIMREIPPMMVRGGPDQTQRVDIASTERIARLG